MRILSNSISIKIKLCPAASCPPCAPDVAGAYNINTSSGCGRPHPHRPDVVGVRLDAPDANRSCPPQQPCVLQTTLPSRYTPCTPLHATPFLTSCDFKLLLPNKPYNLPPPRVSSYVTVLPPDSILSSPPYPLSVPHPPRYTSFRSLPLNPIVYLPSSSGHAPALDLFPHHLRILMFIPRCPADAPNNPSRRPNVSCYLSLRPDVPYNLPCRPDVLRCAPGF